MQKVQKVIVCFSKAATREKLGVAFVQARSLTLRATMMTGDDRLRYSTLRCDASGETICESGSNDNSNNMQDYAIMIICY